MAKPGTFRKGDPRINRKGRPKSFDALRSLTLSYLTAPALNLDDTPILLNGHPATNIEVIIFQCIHSKDWRRLQYVLEVAYGKVPDTLDIQGQLDHAITWKEFIASKDGQP